MKSQFKTIGLTVLIGIFFLSGCYTQFSSTGSHQRQPDFTKIETKVDDQTTVTDYYDNRIYSFYFRHFSPNYAYRHYDPYLDNYYSWPSNYFGFQYNHGFYGHQYGYRYGMGSGNYDYLDYRMDMWYWNRFGNWHHPYNSWPSNSGYVVIVTPHQPGFAEQNMIQRQGRGSTASSSSGPSYYPTVGTGSTSVVKPNDILDNGRSGRSSYPVLPTVITGGSSSGTSSSNTPSTSSTPNTSGNGREGRSTSTPPPTTTGTTVESTPSSTPSTVAPANTSGRGSSGSSGSTTRQGRTRND